MKEELTAWVLQLRAKVGLIGLGPNSDITLRSFVKRGRGWVARRLRLVKRGRGWVTTNRLRV